MCSRVAAQLPPAGHPIYDRPEVLKGRETPALELDFTFKPNAIVLLTDGRLPTNLLATARRNNAGRTAIHTIAFESREGEALLKALAQESNGTYRFVQ